MTGTEIKRKDFLFAAYMSGANHFVFSLVSGVISVMSVSIMNDIGLSRFLLGIAFSMSSLVAICAGSLPGAAIDRLGPKRSMFLSFFLQITPVIFIVFVRTPWAFLLLILLQNLGDVLKVPVTTSVAKSLGLKNASPVIGFNSVGRAVGSLLSQFFAVRIGSRFGGDWRTVMLIFCGIAFLVGISGVLLNLRTHFLWERYSSRGDGEKPRNGFFSLPRERRGLMISLMLLFGGTTGVTVTLGSWLPSLMADRGFNELTASNVLLLNTVGGLAAAILVPALLSRLTERVSLTPWIIAAILLLCGAILLLPPAYVCAASLAAGAAGSFLGMQAQQNMHATAPPDAPAEYAAAINSGACLVATGAVVGIGLMKTTVSQLLFLTLYLLISVAGSIGYIVKTKEN